MLGVRDPRAGSNRDIRCCDATGSPTVTQNTQTIAEPGDIRFMHEMLEARDEKRGLRIQRQLAGYRELNCRLT